MLNELNSIFFNGTTYYAKARFQQGTISYYPVEGNPTNEELEQHLQGEITLGSYTLRPNSSCLWLCLDVDSTDLQKARNITTEISELLNTIPHGIEFSGGKGYHIWIFLTEAVPAERLKAFGIRLRAAVGAATTGDPHVEVFPKQEKLTASSPLGNLVKLPLGKHPKTGNYSLFVDRNNGWETGMAVNPHTILTQKVTFGDIEKIFVEADPLTRMQNLLLPYWVEGERHTLALNLAGYCASLGWSKETTTELFQALLQQGGGDVTNLLQCIETTYSRLAQGQPIQGFSGLNERLPVNVMRQLSDLAGQNIANPLVQIIDRIRLDKGALFLKTRSVERAILSNLREEGKFVKNADNIYWLQQPTHKLFLCEGIAWNALFKRCYGINYKETFGGQVIEGIKLESWASAENAVIHKYFYWDGTNLFLNFGGAEVYSLNGNTRTLGYNGDQNFLFVSNDEFYSEFNGVNLFEKEAKNPWKFLVDDVNFAATVNNPASNIQQQELLKAWILQVFFGELMNTRPIGIFLGVRGSGKTTAARRILRFFEGFHQDVLGLAEDKPDSLRASIEQHLILVLDNLERTKAKWLDSYLNRLSTGAQIELRKLHKTNESYIIRPDVFVLGTGIEIPSSEESLFSRILPLEMDALIRPKPEHYMQTILHDNFIGAWAGMFTILEEVIRSLHANRDINAPATSRLADFQVFCQRLYNCPALQGENLIGGLNKLVSNQQTVMGRSSPAIEALEIWLHERRLTTEHPETFLSISEIFRNLKFISVQNRIESFRWTTPGAFSKHWILLTETLREAYKMETKIVRNTQQGRDETHYRFQNHVITVNL
jgi:hypothetical protein